MRLPSVLLSLSSRASLAGVFAATAVLLHGPTTFAEVPKTAAELFTTDKVWTVHL
jgi:hypothetical protein